LKKISNYNTEEIKTDEERKIATRSDNEKSVGVGI